MLMLSKMDALGLGVLADVRQYRVSSGIRWNVALDDVQDLAREVEADEPPVSGPHLPQAAGQQPRATTCSPRPAP